MVKNKLLVGWVLMAILLTPVIIGAQADEKNNQLNNSGEQIEEPVKSLDGDGLDVFPTELCSLEFRKAEVKNILRSLAIPYEVNLLVSERVKGNKITVSFHDVPVREVVRSILKEANLGYMRDGQILRIDTLGAIKKVKQGIKEVVEPITKNIQVKYAFDSSNSSDLTSLANELKTLTKTEHISVITRTNTLVVTGSPEKVAKVEELVASLDKISPQIAIMSKIVSVSSTYGHELGIQWGGYHDTKVRGAGFTTQGGSQAGGTGPIGAQPYAVNLPAPSVGAGAGGALNLMLGEIGSDLLEVQLSAMESENKGKVLANPKIITQDNQAAKMESTHQVFYPVTTYNSTGLPVVSYSSQNVKINLEVTPHVIDGRIFMDVKVEKGILLDASLAGSPPDVKNNTLTTQVLIGSGETLVIGGLVENDNTYIEGGVQFFKDIPLIGWLFKKKTKSEEKKELLIFITPTILTES